MKKIGVGLTVFCMLIILVGCGSDQLREKKVYGEGYQILNCDLILDEIEAQKVYLQVVRNIEIGKIVETSVNLDFDYTDLLKGDSKGTAKKAVHSGLNLMCDAFEKEGYLDCYYTADNSIYTVSMGMDINSLGESVAMENASLENIKSELEKQTELKVSNCFVK